MSKKVLILSASPRRGGNSDTLCDEFLRGARDAGHTAEKIFLRDRKINYCTGCGYCVDNAKKGCSQKDDAAEILEKMIAADTIVLATPIYFYTMDGQMKTLIDRTCARYTEMKNKEFYFIFAAWDSNPANMERTLEEFRGFTECCLDGAVEKGVIYGTGAWKIGDVKTMPAMLEAYEAGKNC